MVSASEYNRKVREAQRKHQQEVDRVNRANKKIVDDHNRKVNQHNQRVVDERNRQIRAANQQNQRALDNHNRQIAATNQYNEQVVRNLTSQLNAASQPRKVTYTVRERELVDRVQEATVLQDDREYDIFLSYARLDGGVVAQTLRDALVALGVTVWFDELAIKPGKSMVLQMDQGLRRARAGIALLTASYLTGRFWTERELGALLHKETLIPVLHGVTFADVKEYSGILPDLAGFSTEYDDVQVIAEKIAVAVLSAEAA